MKFIHLADCHLGDRFDFKSGLSNQIRENNKNSLEDILRNNKDLDFLLIAGDLYERSLFTLKDYKELFDCIEDFGKDVFYVAGNHDYIGEENEAIFKMKPTNLHIFNYENLEYYEINSTRIYGLSYRDRIFSKDFSYDIDLDSDYFNILLVHATINNPESPYLNLNLDKLKKIGFDYVALGHIHKWENFGNNIYYAGSIEPSDFSDIYDYGYILFDQGEITHIDSSIMQFYDLELNLDNFKDENELISYLNTKLKSNKENYLRLNIDGTVNTKKIREGIRADYLEIKLTEVESLYNLVNLYPNSLLEKYRKKFPQRISDMEKRALELGLDAIYRSRDD
ncbi:metallophosphoesterase [Anaerococcus murdochii]|uniref:Metallophosphoesterase n=1 Tax=Anaerococcus murdochii TaxID=411577 RepID=A0ABS7T0H3_9FIRM|nr:metallophosphoesterase [Anaerococcus murdochii]MBZ2387285.1 metallophosphoesterase [Anaerococcus murdochii]